ncbi:hypothetical protein JMJ55_28355 [Belnapia sp. T6]|uniref:YARHG domain-containing protein n=1 Tax=Belnapia mucosa TaxID=2804532 RepID=A0ABS1VC48_9PROT|nr:hypothetical protein [Belnapia mucosa]MBL6459239.1 hypothetical protein [Belnapia mucosa]
MASRPGMEGSILAALPPGWRAIGRCRFGTAGPIGPASGCYALAHPLIGVALIDVAPDATPNAEARLRRALAAADFWSIFPGSLPVWHGRIEPGALRNLAGILAEGFNSLPPLTVPGKDRWVNAAQTAIADDQAWEVPGQPPRPAPSFALPPEEEPEADAEEVVPAPRRRRRRRGGLMLAGGLAVLLLLIGGLALLPAAERPQPQTASLAQPAPAATPSPPPALPPIQRVILPVPTTAPIPDPPPKAPEPEAAPEPAATPPSAEPVPTLAVEEDGPALETPPPAPPAPPPVRRAAVAPKPRIDPSCSRALFRFQQGERLSAAEEAYVRSGCATRR